MWPNSLITTFKAEVTTKPEEAVNGTDLLEMLKIMEGCSDIQLEDVTE